MDQHFEPGRIAEAMRASRQYTHHLFDIVIAEADLRRPPAEGFRPILWHLGHVGAFEEYWLLQRVKGDPAISPHYSVIFDPIKTPRDDSKNLPPIPEIEGYLARVREGVLSLLDAARPDDHPLLRGGHVFDMVIEHEYQHQETLAYLLQMLDPRLKCRPSEPIIETQSNGLSEDMVSVPGGPFEMGSVGYPFAYDNEQPPHVVEVGDFRMDKYPVTNAAYARFIAAGGYRTRSLWGDEGWAWKEENNIEHPLYWTPVEGGEGWRVREMFEESDLKPDHPVTGVSWHEAEAYARFAGKRLPTETEWEKAASWNPAAGHKRRFSWGDAPPDFNRTNFRNHYWGTTPVDAFPTGRSAYECMDLTGNVWEWTATVFGPYPGFEAYPYDEYSKLWFDGDHRVLKGGSWTTTAPLLRCSFRNFFRPRFRYAFAGFRCAAD